MINELLLVLFPGGISPDKYQVLPLIMESLGEAVFLADETTTEEPDGAKTGDDWVPQEGLPVDSGPEESPEILNLAEFGLLPAERITERELRTRVPALRQANVTVIRDQMHRLGFAVTMEDSERTFVRDPGIDSHPASL